MSVCMCVELHCKWGTLSPSSLQGDYPLPTASQEQTGWRVSGKISHLSWGRGWKAGPSVCPSPNKTHIQPAEEMGRAVLSSWSLEEAQSGQKMGNSVSSPQFAGKSCSPSSELQQP